MPQVASPEVQPRLLQKRLAALRRRLRFVVTFRGVSWLLTVLLLAAAGGGLLDWRVHLPSVVRALILVSGLSAAGYLAYRHLFLSLWNKTDNLTLALRIEDQYPALNDSLASTVEFIEQGLEPDPPGAPTLRGVAVARALHQVQRYNFNRMVNTRGVGTAGLSMLLTGGLAIALLVLYPSLARTALLRLANPFGGLDWPRQTQLEVAPFKNRIARNELFEVRATLHGVIPEKATVVYRLEGFSQLEQSHDVTHESADTASVVARLEPNRVQRSFTFQVRANDAASEWFKVTVLPPPLLVPLDGRASPQVSLRYPAYTDLPPSELPDGNGNVEAVAGTLVTLRAAADRPLSRAWIEYQPEPRFAEVAAFVGPLGSLHAAGMLALTAVGESVWGNIPAQLGADRQTFTLQFLPRVSGTYTLHFEDETGLGNNRLFELHVLADPPPVVQLDRPSPKLDTLDMLPGADFTLHVVAEDALFAVRSAYLEYRTRRGLPEQPAREEQPGRVALYDHGTVLGAVRLLGPLAPSFGAKRQQVQVQRRLSLSQFKHQDGNDPVLKEGDVLILQACADDFDDVALDKQPGRSHEVEIRIVSRNTLEVILNQDQGKVQQELVRLREQQREALKKVAEAEKRWNRGEKLTPEEVAQLLQAEQLQQQIRERVGDKQDGLRAEAKRVLETLENNHLPRSAAHERMEMVGTELDRLAREELEQIEPRLTNARKQSETGEKRPQTKQDENLLTDARQHQEEVEKTLNDLLARLEPWSSTREIKGEAKAILQEQRDLNKETEGLQKNLGSNREELSRQQKDELDRTAAAQQKLQERTAQLLEQMKRVSEQREQKDPETAQELKKAHETGTKSGVTGMMKTAQQQISKNNLGEAAGKQREAIEKMQELVKELEDKREAELDRLAKKLREAEQRLDELTRKQEELQKKVKEAGQIADAKKREEELKRLAREQKQLQQEAQEMVKQLSRMRQERASQALGKASGQMEQAGGRMDQGRNQDAAEQQDEALDRLDEARRELERAREVTEEELAREQLAKVTDVIKRLKERQDALVAEMDRIQRELLQRSERRNLLLSLVRLKESQKGLAAETKGLAEDKLSASRVFARIMQKSAAAMEQAAENMEKHKDLVNQEGQADTPAGQEAVRLQKEALRRLEQLLDVLKPENALAQRRPQNGGQEGGQGGGQGGDGGQGGGAGDGIPQLAQLKLLRSLQAEINQRTDEFAKQHPDPNKLTEKEKAELQGIRREQQEVADLLDILTQPADAEGGKP